MPEPKTDSPNSKQRKTKAADFLSGGGEIGKAIRSRDWSRTSLGAADRWPQSLKSVVRIMLGSRYAIWIGWGPDLTFLYNEAYRAMTLGKKHPWALGRPAREVWAEAWEDLGPRVDEVIRRGRATYDEQLLLLLERSGYPEETYHTFSYSPLPDDEGNVGGLLCIVVEDTERYIAERRLNVLREVAAEVANARTVESLFDAIRKCLGANAHDLPFTLIYLAEPDRQSLRLVSSTGFPPGAEHPAAPEVIEAGRDNTWPVSRVLSHAEARVVEDLANRFSNLPAGAWDKAPTSAVIVPIAQHGQAQPAGVMIVGTNPYRPLDDTYKDFINLLAGQIAAGLADVRAYEEEKKRAEALAEIDRAKTTFFSNVSHEFRTPLTLILSPLEEMLVSSSGSNLVTAERNEVESIHRNSLRLLKLVNTLLDFSRIEAGRVQAFYEPVDLSSYTAELASSFRSAMDRGGLKFEIDCRPLPERVYVDRDMWEKIVLNLISNALKYTLEGKVTVSVGAASDGNNAQLLVRDTGVGIPEEELPRVFDRFHRIEGQIGRTQEGTGIGLALVQELVKVHGGSVHVESQVGKGSTFTVSIPFGNRHIPAERIGDAKLVPTQLRAQVFVEEALRWLADTPEPGLDLKEEITSSSIDTASLEKKPLVLVADDNADMREYITRLLSARFDVRTVGDGRALLQAARVNPPDAILSDVMMPGLDGFALLRELRNDPDLRSIPVVLLSARAGEDSRIEGLEAGADDYLVKPFSGRELIARVESTVKMALLRREKEGALRESERRLSAEAEALNKLNQWSSRLWRCRDLHTGLDEMLDAVIELLGADKGNVQLLDENGQLKIVAHRGFGEDFLEYFREVSIADNSVCARALRSGERTIIEDVENDSLYEPLRSIARAEGYRAVISTPLIAGDGTPEGMLSMHFGSVHRPDEQQLRRLDLYVRQASDFIARCKTEEVLREREEALRESDRLKNEFLAVLGHELRNPLAPIYNTSELLSRTLAKHPQAQASLAVIKRQTEQLMRMVDDLLDVARITQGHISLQRQPVELSSVVAQGVETTDRLLRDKQHQLSIVSSFRPVYVSGDAARLAQCVSNLVSNAAKYTDHGGRIRVETRAEGSTAMIEVSDNGIGIPETLMPRIFELFVQGDQSLDRAQGGLGIGLPVVRRLVEMHGGRISAHSAGVGRGSKFEIRLPRIEAPAAAGNEIEPANVPSRRIFIVDDNVDAAEALALLLEMDGHEVQAVKSSREAIERIESFKPDIALLDIGLPEIDGYDLLRHLRAIPALRDVRFIAVTGYGRPEDRERIRQAGFESHLVKPVTMSMLARALMGSTRLPEGAEEID